MTMTTDPVGEAKATVRVKVKAALNAGHSITAAGLVVMEPGWWEWDQGRIVAARAERISRQAPSCWYFARCHSTVHGLRPQSFFDRYPYMAGWL